MNGIYIIRAKGTDHYKVGTATNLRMRIDTIMHGSPHPLTTLIYVQDESDADVQTAREMVAAFLRGNGKEMNFDWYCVGKEVAEEAADMLKSALTPSPFSYGETDETGQKSILSEGREVGAHNGRSWP